MEEPFFSAEQERLAALLEKVTSLVPFSSNEACSDLFEAIVAFSRDSLEQKNVRSKREFFQLDIVQLIDLSKTSSVKRERETCETSPSLSKFGKGGFDKQDITKWTFEEAYNIVEVTGLVEFPFQIHVLAKPPVAGNQKSVARVMDEVAFGSIASLKGRNATKLKKKLNAALLAFCKSEADATRIVVAKLNDTEWGKELANDLSDVRCGTKI